MSDRDVHEGAHADRIVGRDATTRPRLCRHGPIQEQIRTAQEREFLDDVGEPARVGCGMRDVRFVVEPRQGRRVGAPEAECAIREDAFAIDEVPG